MTKKGLSEVSSMSLEAKAGIVAVLYGLERLFAASGAAGTGLTNFAALTGVSAQTLQKWQYAARQAGESNEDLAASFKGVQNSMTNMILGKGAPEGMAILSRVIKDFDPTRIRDTAYMMQVIAEAAQKLPKDVGNAMLKSFGVTEAYLAASRRGVFTEANFAKAPTYGEGELKALDRANIAWSNLGVKIEMAIGHFNALHGQGLVADISKLTSAFLKLANALVGVSDKYKLFEKLSYWVNQLSGALDQLSGNDKTKRNFWGDQLDDKGKVKTGVPLWEGGAGNMFHMIGDWLSLKETKDKFKNIAFGDTVLPSFRSQPPSESTQSVDVKQTVVFQNPDNAPQKTANALKKAVGDYIKQSPVKVQGA